jgi:hypothetical protein
MGKKLNSKNHLTLAPTSFSFEISLKNQRMILKKFKVVQDLEHGEIDY